MKVLMISEYFHPFGKGGGEISAMLLAKELSKAGIEIHVLTSFFPGTDKEEEYDGIKIHRRLKTGQNPSSMIENIKRALFFEKSLLKELKKIDSEENFDIIHCMNVTSIPAVKVKDKLNKKFILHVNSPILFCPKGTLIYKDKEPCNVECCRAAFLDCYFHSTLVGKFELSPFIKFNPFFIYMYRKRYEKYGKLIQKFDHYIAISEFMKKGLLKKGLAENKISVIYNIVELERFSNLKPPKNKIPKILYLGEYSRPKGPQLLIEALKEMKKPYVANFYGDGVLKDFLIKEAKKYRLNAIIHEKAKYEEIPKIMQKHDIVVIPSLVGEAFGRVALEAVAAGKRVIASDVGGIGEILGETNIGETFVFNNLKELNKLLAKSLNIEIVDSYVFNNKKFSKHKNIMKIINTYNSI